MRGKRIAFGDGSKLIWDQNSEPVFRNNPNVVFPGSPLNGSDVEWVRFYKGCRQYSTQEGDRWRFNYDFHVQPGEFFFTAGDEAAAERLSLPKKFIVIEPNVKRHLTIRGAYLANKAWPLTRYQQDLPKIRRLGQHAANLDAIFYHRLNRCVRKDGTVSYQGARFEVPFELAGKTVCLVVDPHRAVVLGVEDKDGQALGAATPLDALANAHRVRCQSPQPATEPAPRSGPNLIELAYQQHYRLEDH